MVACSMQRPLAPSSDWNHAEQAQRSPLLRILAFRRRCFRAALQALVHSLSNRAVKLHSTRVTLAYYPQIAWVANLSTWPRDEINFVARVTSTPISQY